MHIYNEYDHFGVYDAPGCRFDYIFVFFNLFGACLGSVRVVLRHLGVALALQTPIFISKNTPMPSPPGGHIPPGDHIPGGRQGYSKYIEILEIRAGGSLFTIPYQSFVKSLIRFLLSLYKAFKGP